MWSSDSFKDWMVSAAQTTRCKKRLKIDEFWKGLEDFPIYSPFTIIRLWPERRFTPNLTQTIIGPYQSITNIYVIIRQYFVKICKIVCFQHNVQEIVVLYFGRFMDYQNSFDNFLSGRFTHVQMFKLPRRSLKKYFFHCLQLCEWKVRVRVQKWAWPIPNNSAEFREHIGPVVQR